MNEVYDANVDIIERCIALVAENGLILNDSRVLFTDRLTLTIGKYGDLLVRFAGEIVVNTHWRHTLFVPGEWTGWITSRST